MTLIVLFSGAVYFFLIRYSFDDFYKRLEIRAVVAAKAILEEESSIIEEVRAQHLEKLPEEKEYFFKVSSEENFTSEANQLNLPITFFSELLETGSANHQNNEIFFSGIRYESNNDTYVVIVSAENYYHSHHLTYLRSIFLVAVVLMSILAFTVAIVFSKNVLTPVKKITEGVKEISAKNLHKRLSPINQNDVISGLVTTFNYMLDRLETAFATQNNFISNASHELGTPLTGIIGEAEVALSKNRTAQEYIDALRIILQEAEKLDKITKSLLMLAQSGFDGKRQKFERLRADQLCWDIKETFDKIYPNNKVKFNTNLLPDDSNKLKIKGNQPLLNLALSNVVNNACKYSNNKPVTLSIATSDDNVVIVVQDQGIGIPKSDMPFIYDLFFRASNTKNYEGYGIGLPLTFNIVRLHEGELRISSEQDVGTTVEILFPIYPPEAT